MARTLPNQRKINPTGFWASMDRVTTDELVVRAVGKRIIAISGFGGAGKSTVAARLANALSAVVVAGDDFSTGQQGSRDADWSSIDRARIAAQVLIPARANGTIRYQQYDWPNDRLGDWTEFSTPTVLIIEGIGLIHPVLAGYFDLTVWVDVPLEIAGERGKYRDREIYKVDHDEMWATVWIPNDRDYFSKYRPDERADLLLIEDLFEALH